MVKVKINLQKLIAFLFSRNNQLGNDQIEKKKKQNTTSRKAIKTIKTLEINLRSLQAH